MTCILVLVLTQTNTPLVLTEIVNVMKGVKIQNKPIDVIVIGAESHKHPPEKRLSTELLSRVSLGVHKAVKYYKKTVCYLVYTYVYIDINILQMCGVHIVIVRTDIPVLYRLIKVV